MNRDHTSRQVTVLRFAPASQSDKSQENLLLDPSYASSAISQESDAEKHCTTIRFVYALHPGLKTDCLTRGRMAA